MNAASGFGLLTLVALGGLVACTTPPVGWEGAGRLQTLPMQQPDSAAPGIDSGDDAAGDDSGGGGPDPGAPVLDGGLGGDFDGGLGGDFDGGLGDGDDSGVTDAADAG